MKNPGHALANVGAAVFVTNMGARALFFSSFMLSTEGCSCKTDQN